VGYGAQAGGATASGGMVRRTHRDTTDIQGLPLRVVDAEVEHTADVYENRLNYEIVLEQAARRLKQTPRAAV